MAITAQVLAGNQAELEIEVGPHGKRDLLVYDFEAEERISELFELTATLVPRRGLQVDGAALLGQRAVFRVLLGGGEARTLDGIVARVRTWEEGAGDARGRVRVTVVPKAWRLGKVVRSRIFQELSAPDIVARVLKEGEVEHRLALSGSYPRRTYCVQYRESDLDFVSRLLEDEGIFWFFEHADGGSRMVLGDAPGVHPAVAGDGRLAFRERSGMVPGRDHADAFAAGRELRAGTVTLRDFDAQRPALDLTASAKGEGEEAGLEVYDYPGGYLEPAEGQARSRRRLEAERARAALHRGSSVCRRLTPGHTFHLEEHPVAALNEEYLLVAVSHRGQQPEVLGGLATQVRPRPEAYRNDFVCVPRSLPWRPEQRTARPLIPGAQTALVVGPAGEEIHTDAHGRVKVQFHWDREGHKDDRSSCWIRVSQAWAGPGWGALYLPRIGQEVVVQFLEGDPDRPLVTGSVYNGENPPPVALPAEKTRSTLRSASSPGGEGSNELRFEDAAGQEEVYLHAQKDLNVVVENDRTERIGGNDRLTVQRDRSREVNGSQSLQVALNDSSTIGASQSLTVAGNRTTTVGGVHTEAVSGSQSVSVGGAQSVGVVLAAAETVGLGKALNVGGAYAVTVGGLMNELVVGLKAEEIGGAKVEVVGKKKTETVLGSRSLSVGGDMSEKVGKSRTLAVGKDLKVSVGTEAQQVVKKGYRVRAKQIVLSADDRVTLQCGKASIQLKKNGDVVVKGAKVQVTASGDIVLKGAKIAEN